MATTQKLPFASDYQQGAHPDVLAELVRTNLESSPGYGFDPYSDAAREAIRKACACPGAEVQFLVGGTQTNAVTIDSLLPAYQGVVAAETGHVAAHEAGAIELTRHKVLTVPQTDGKVSASTVRAYCQGFFADENHEHMVMPGLVYISQPTEYGTLYSLAELEDLRLACDEFGLYLYADGARLAYALGSARNDVTLADLARLCDAFYIGGTKCGTLMGEAVVVPNPKLIPHFFTQIKSHGALLAKGRLMGVQFGALFTDDLYLRIGREACARAQMLQAALAERDYELLLDTPTNQVFCVMEDDTLAELGTKVDYSFWERRDDNHTVIRLATSWATTDEHVEQLIALL